MCVHINLMGWTSMTLNICICLHIYTHTHIHTYTHTYIHAHMHTYIRVYTSLHAGKATEPTVLDVIEIDHPNVDCRRYIRNFLVDAHALNEVCLVNIHTHSHTRTHTHACVCVFVCVYIYTHMSMTLMRSPIYIKHVYRCVFARIWTRRRRLLKGPSRR